MEEPDFMDIDPPPDPPPPLGNKKKNTPKGKVYRPNSLVAERPEKLAIQYMLPPNREVLPPRARQTELTLLPVGMHVRGGSFLECVAHNNSWHTSSASETIKHMAANELTDSIQESKARLNAELAQATLNKARAETNYSRMATLDLGNINKITPKNLSGVTHEQLEKELHEQEVKFFMDDPLSSSDDDESSEEDASPDSSPLDVPIFRRLYDVNGTAYLRRNEVLRDASMAGHRDIEIVNKSHNDFMCHPLVPPTTYRYCKLVNACICRSEADKLGTPDVGYIGREYLAPKKLQAWQNRRAKGIPVSVQNDGPIGLCYHDWKVAVNERLHECLKFKDTLPESIQPFAVIVGKGEYAADVCWNPIDSTTNVATGVTGRFPMYLNICLQYVPKTLDGRTFTYLAEINADFQPRLSQANMCLGTFKSQPICNSQNGQRYVRASSIAIFTPRWSLEKLADWPEWALFTRSLYKPVLADRQLLFPVETTAVNRKLAAVCERVPVAWLRRTLLLLTPSLIEDRVRVLLSESLEKRLTQQFHVTRLAPVLCECLAVALSSFERSVAHYMSWLRDPEKCHWIRVFFIHLLDRRERTEGWEAAFDYFRDFPMPPAPVLGEASDWVLWSCALWRCAVSRFVETLIPPRDRNQALRENYQWRLYRGTHLTLFKTCCEHRRYDDQWLLGTCPPVLEPRTTDPFTTCTPNRVARLKPWPWLALVYPACHAVICAEELPALSLTQTYTGHWFDMGNRKKQKMIVSATTQTFTIKPMGRSCLGRNASEMQTRTFGNFPVTFQLFSLIVQCVMLGHVPIPLESMSLLSMVRISASFGNYTTPEVQQRFRAFMTQMRILPRLFLALFHYGYTLPQCPSMWAHHQSLSRSLSYVSVLHETNSVWRRAIDQQITSLTSHVDWAGVETPCNITSDMRINSTGRMAVMHDRALQFYTKIKKGRFEEVLRRKLTAVENKLGDLRIDEHVAELTKGDYMHCLLFVAWVAAKRSHSPYAPPHAHITFTFKYLRALKITKYGRRWLKRLTTQYHTYDQHDDAIKAKGIDLYEHNSMDYHRIKTLVVAFAHFRDQRPFLISLREKRLTLFALRTALGLERHTSSPPLMGVSHYCEGCRNCGNDTTEPSAIAQSDMDTIRRVVDNSKQAAWTLPSLAYGYNARDADVAGFGKIYYNPAKCALYCRRRRGEPTQKDEVTVPDLDEQEVADEAEVIHDHRQTLFENLAADTRLTTRSLMNAFSDFGRDPLEEAEPASEPVKSGKASSKDRDLVTRRALGEALLNCAQPMIEVDTVGVYWKSYNNIHTRCAVCGRPCLGHSAHYTNTGMTCGNHVNIQCYGDHHRMWWVWNISRNEAISLLQPTSVVMVPCYICQSRRDMCLLRVYDMRFKLFVISLCSYHLNQCSHLLPVRSKGGRLPWVRIDHLNAAARGYNKKMYM